MEEMVSNMEAQKVSDTEQLIRTSTDSEAPEVELAELGEFPILHQFDPHIPIGNCHETHSC